MLSTTGSTGLNSTPYRLAAILINRLLESIYGSPIAPLPVGSFSAAHTLGNNSTFRAGLFILCSSPNTMMELQTSWCVRAS